MDTIGSAIYAQGGIVAAVCHGSAALLNIHDGVGNPIIIGKRVTGFSNAEENTVGLSDIVPYLLQDVLIAKGARYQEGSQFESFVVRDERLITGQNPQSAAKVGQAMVEALRNEI